ncbi:MAG TPA: MerR family transcriptional regulator [Candidatus Limiplasma pullistercoris]|nr:MerR family transcriptional regulator [Candidatus Limiplasma pullistercoris]
MKRNLLSIGKMAEMNQVTVPTLRLYDQLGLLKPRHVDGQTGYRYYDINQNARLDMIAYMKELGMSLKEIQGVLEAEDIALIEQILARKNEQIHEQMRALRLRHNAVERAIASIERYRKSPATGTIALEYIDRRYVWGIPCPENFYEKDIASYEQALMDLRRALLKKNCPQIHSYNTGTSITRENFAQGRFVADRVFIFTDQQAQACGLTASVVDSGMYACIYLDHYDDEIACAGKLLAFCRNNGYRVAGDYLCEVLTEFNVFDGDQRSMFLRLQVPVDFSRTP